MVSLKHLFQSGKADGTDVTLVKPTNWNEEHKFETAADSVVLGRSVGAGPGPVQELPLTSIFPSGMIMPYAGTGTPVSWLRCEGQVLNRADYDPLFQAISTYFNIGGETAAQFRLPDLRGRVIMGVDAAGVATTAAWYAGGNPALLAARGGVQFEQASLNVPKLFVRVGYWNDPVQTSTAAGSVTLSGETGGASVEQYGLQFGGGGTFTGSHTHTQSGSFGITWNAAGFGAYGQTDAANVIGSTTAITNVPPALTLYYLIKT